MYRFSRSIYREIASDVVEDERDPTGCATSRPCSTPARA